LAREFIERETQRRKNRQIRYTSKARALI